jgi:Transposase DDE domain
MKKKIFTEINKALCELSPALAQGHALKRINSLTGLISGMINKKSSHLSKIGTGLDNDTDANSQEKHTKRFLENKYTDYKVHYLPYLSCFIASISQNKQFLTNVKNLKLVIDGSQMGSKHVALMISIVVGKRAIPVFWVVKKGKKGHFPTEMHLDVVRKTIEALRSFVSADTTFTLLGDGEFDSVDLQRCCRQELHIGYVFRTACDSVMYENDDEFIPKNIKLEANVKSYFIPSVDFSKEKFEDVHFLYWFDQKIYDEPLFLISTFDNAPDIIDAYKQRFAIETMFKDLKTRGFNLHKNRLGKIASVTNLIMVAALAFCFMMNFGIANCDNSLKIKVQRKDKNTNSVFSFAVLFLEYLCDKGREFIFCPNMNQNFFKNNHVYG